MTYMTMVQKLDNMHCPGFLEYIEKSNLTCTNKTADHICEKSAGSRLI